MLKSVLFPNLQVTIPSQGFRIPPPLKFILDTLTTDIVFYIHMLGIQKGISVKFIPFILFFFLFYPLVLWKSKEKGERERRKMWITR